MRELSNQAKVAKLCKDYLKNLGIRGSCKSQGYSMGDCVTIKVLDLSPSMTEKLKREFAKYQYGYWLADMINKVFGENRNGKSWRRI